MSDFDTTTAVGFGFVIIVIFIFIWFISEGSPAEPPEPKDDPDKAEQRRLASEILKGNTNPDEVAEMYGYDVEHIKQWTVDYLHDAEADHNLREILGKMGK